MKHYSVIRSDSRNFWNRRNTFSNLWFLFIFFPQEVTHKPILKIYLLFCFSWKYLRHLHGYKCGWSRAKMMRIGTELSHPLTSSQGESWFLKAIMLLLERRCWELYWGQSLNKRLWRSHWIENQYIHERQTGKTKVEGWENPGEIPGSTLVVKDTV